MVKNLLPLQQKAAEKVKQSHRQPKGGIAIEAPEPSVTSRPIVAKDRIFAMMRQSSSRKGDGWPEKSLRLFATSIH
jgi:hypothetical protein